VTINLITLETVKDNLGLSSNEYDTKITNMIPIVSNDVRRILNCQYDTVIPAEIDNGSSIMRVGYEIDLGCVLHHPDLPDDTYTVSYDWENAEYTLSDVASADIDYINPTISIGQQAAISKMIYYKISKKTTSDVNRKNIQAESIGTVSYTYAPNEINSQWNYPQALIDDLGVPFAEVG